MSRSPCVKLQWDRGDHMSRNPKMTYKHFKGVVWSLKRISVDRDKESTFHNKSVDWKTKDVMDLLPKEAINIIHYQARHGWVTKKRTWGHHNNGTTTIAFTFLGNLFHRLKFSTKTMNLFYGGLIKKHRTPWLFFQKLELVFGDKPWMDNIDENLMTT